MDGTLGSVVKFISAIGALPQNGEKLGIVKRFSQSAKINADSV
jgi:hypothetical protein